MKVFGITCGRKNGNSEILLKEAFKAIERNCDAETSFVRLQDASIIPCTGCETCGIKHRMGDADFRCIHKKEDDHLFFIETQLREADAVIISVPVYNLLPPGIFITFLNKLHAAGDYRQKVHEKPKLGAAITVGGTDWTNYGMPIASMGVMEYIGGFNRIVDHLDVKFNPSVGAVLLDNAAMSRAYKLGENIADALKTAGTGKVAFKGDQGVCPTCHTRLIEIREDGIFCPMCETIGEAALENGKLKINFTDEALGKNRWGEWGRRLHGENVMKGHKKALASKDEISAKRKEYADYKQPLTLPNIGE